MPTLAADNWITMARSGVNRTISRAEEKTVTTDGGETTFDTDICRLELTGEVTRTTWKEVAHVDPLLVRMESDGWVETATGANPPT